MEEYSYHYIVFGRKEGRSGKWNDNKLFNFVISWCYKIILFLNFYFPIKTI